MAPAGRLARPVTRLAQPCVIYPQTLSKPGAGIPVAVTAHEAAVAAARHLVSWVDAFESHR